MAFKPLLFAVILILEFSVLSPAINATQTYNKIWTALGLNTNVGKFAYQFEPQARFIDRPLLRLEQSLNNIGGGYLYSSHWAFWLGSTWIMNIPVNTPSNHELRLWQQIIYNTSVELPVLTIRSRFEERQLQNFTQWNYRLRERFTYSRALTPKIALLIYDELFININRPTWVKTNVFEQNRIQIGVNQEIAPWLTLGPGYLYQYIFAHPPLASHVLVINAQIIFSSKSFYY